MAKYGHLDGVSDVVKSMRGLSEAIQRNVGRRSLKKTAQALADRHKSVLPVSDSPYDKTPGSLKAAPKVVPAKGGKKGRVAVAMLIEDPAAARGEYGTKKMPPHLKVRSTTDAMHPELNSIFAESLKEEVDAVAKREAR